MEKGPKNPIVSFPAAQFVVLETRSCMQQEGNGVNLDGTPLLAPVEVDMYVSKFSVEGTARANG